MTETPELPADRGQTTQRHGDPVLDADQAEATQVESTVVEDEQEDAELTD